MLRAEINFNSAVKLPGALSQRITRVAGWQEAAGPYSRGRSGLITLDKPLSVELTREKFWLRAVKIKGLGDFSDLGAFQPPQPIPHQGWASFFWTVDGTGNIGAERPFPLFRGGLDSGRAENEYHLSQKAIEAGVPAGLPIGWGVFPDINYRGQQAGFVILGLDEPRDRRWGRLLKSGDLSPNGRLTIDPDLEAVIKREISQRKMSLDDRAARQIGCELFEKWGRSLRRLHDAGIIHKVPHDENYSIFRLVSGLLADCFMVHDLDLSFTADGLNDKQDFLYRLIDLAYLMRSVNVMSLTPFGLFLNLDRNKIFTGATYRAVCRGYFGAELAEKKEDEFKAMFLSIFYANDKYLTAGTAEQALPGSLTLDPRHAELDLVVQQMSLVGFYDAISGIMSERGMDPPYESSGVLKGQAGRMRDVLLKAQREAEGAGLFNRLKRKLGLKD